MTGREWYTVRWNVAPMGPSCYAVSAQDGLCTFIQPDKTVSSQNRISPKQRKEKVSLCCYFFLCFFRMPQVIKEGPQLLLKWLSFKPSGTHAQEPQGEVPRWKASESRSIQPRRKINFSSLSHLWSYQLKSVPVRPEGVQASHAELLSFEKRKNTS